MAEPDKQPELIKIFPLADPQEWIANADLILKTIVSAIAPCLPGFVTPQYLFNIDPVSGWIRYSLTNDLWHKNPKRSPPENAAAATQAASEFLRRLQSACQEKDYLRSAISPLLPDKRFARIVPAGTAPVFHVAKPWIDHWLCRFEVYLRPFDNDEEARVFGSAIDLRIGQAGKVTGLVSHWRPARLGHGRPVQMVLPAEEKEEHNHAEEEHSPPALVYELGGENCPQTFLTPYYLSLEGHHGGMLPASSHSLLVGMTFAEEKGRVYVIPSVSGGSGAYSLNWAYWRPDALFDEGLVSLGEQQFIDLPPGVYNVMLHVTDRGYEVTQMCENMVFFTGELRESPSPGPATSHPT